MPGSFLFDECKRSARWLPTLRPSQPTWAESACRLLSSTPIIATYYNYSGHFAVLRKVKVWEGWVDRGRNGTAFYNFSFTFICKREISACDLELWLMALTHKPDLDRVRMNQRAKYRRERSKLHADFNYLSAGKIPSVSWQNPKISKKSVSQISRSWKNRKEWRRWQRSTETRQLIVVRSTEFAVSPRATCTTMDRDTQRDNSRTITIVTRSPSSVGHCPTTLRPDNDRWWMGVAIVPQLSEGERCTCSSIFGLGYNNISTHCETVSHTIQRTIQVVTSASLVWFISLIVFRQFSLL